MIRITEDLIAKGHAYTANDGVYFGGKFSPGKIWPVDRAKHRRSSLWCWWPSRRYRFKEKDHKDFACGSQQNLASRLGILHGDQADLVGILSVCDVTGPFWTTI